MYERPADESSAFGRGVRQAVLGYLDDRKSHIYFFENLPYKLLENQLDANLIRPESGRIISKEAAEVFREILQHKYIYTDFCVKNIMFDHISCWCKTRSLPSTRFWFI
jgi:hypothetical protein